MRPEEHHGGHPARNPVRGLVDLVDEERVALGGATAEVVVDEADREAGDGEQPEQPVVV